MSNYTANLPNQTDRAGVFSLLRASGTVSSQRAINTTLSSSLLTQISELLHSHLLNLTTFPLHHPHLLSTVSSRKGAPLNLTNLAIKIQIHKTQAREIGTADDLSSSDEEEGEDFKKFPLVAPPLSHSSSTPTLVDDPPKALRAKS